MMKATIVESPFGILAFDQQGKRIGESLFPKDPRKAATAMIRAEVGKFISEAQSLIKTLQEIGCDRFVFENPNLAEAVRNALNIEIEVSKNTEVGDRLRSNPEQFALETGFVKDHEEFNLWMHNASMEIAKLRVRGAIERRDLIAAQAIQALDDLDRTINLLMSRIREWYGVNFPELDRHLEKHETYCRLVVHLGSREDFTPENLAKEDIPEAKIPQIAKAAEMSMGADIAEQDLKEIQTLCKSVLSLYEMRQDLEKYMDNIMNAVAPNVMSLVGSLLGARLIAIAGGLPNIARLPASTIQILGAEKALFRSLKTGTRPPKHGLIFQHTYLHDAKRWQRGKLARALAGKLAIAARADAYGGRDISKRLKEDLNRRVEEIREKYSEPPPIQEKKPQSPREQMRRPQHGGNWRKRRRERQR
jgi:nucleolar protein 56